MSVVIVGSLAYDSIETPYESGQKLLGGAATYSSISASYFVKSYVVGIVGRDFGESEFQVYKKHNIDISNVKIENSGLTFHWKGYYEGDMNTAHTLDTQLNVFASFDPELTEELRNMPYLFLANIDPDIQYKVLKQMTKPKLVVCDTMNFWIENKLTSLERLIREIDVLIINDGEAKMLTGNSNLIKAAKEILNKYGIPYLVVKKGEHGSMLFTKENIFAIPAYPLTEVIDPTGAGDTYAGGFIGYIARRDNTDETTIRQAMVVGTIMSSYTVQGLGIKIIDSIDKNKIYDRIKDYKKIIEYGVINEF